jgi:tetratricopeptide (TPR) repeat protein
VKTLSAPSGRFIFAIILVPFLIQAQPITTKIDSLESLLSSSTGVEKFQVFAGLFNETKQTNFDAALSYARQANSVAVTMGDSVLIVEGGRMMAYTLDDLGRNQEAINILHKVIQIAERNQFEFSVLKQKIKNLYNNAAILYMNQGQYDSSLSFHFKSLELRELEADKKSIANSKNNIGLVYFKLEDYNNALIYYSQALELKKELGDATNQDRILINMGLSYNEKGDIPNAIECFDEVLSLCKDYCPDETLMELYYGLGRANYLNDSKIESYKFYLKSLKIARIKDIKSYVVHNLIGLSIIERSNKNYPQSLAYLKEANDLVPQTGNIIARLVVYRELFKIYKLRDNCQMNALFLEKYINLRDSIYNGELLKNITKIQNDYQQQINLQIIKEKEKSLVLQNEIIERQHLQTILIAIISGLFLFIIILLYSNYRKKVKFEVILEARVKSRTAELEISRFTLEQQNYEQLTIIQKTVMENKSLLATLHGSFNLATRELKDPIAVNYFLSIRKMVGQLEESFKTLHHNLAQTDKSPQK